MGIACSSLLLRIVNVIPGNVEKNGLDGYNIQTRRKLDNIIEIGTAKGIFVQLLDKRSVAFILIALSLHLPQVIDMDNGTVALQLAINHLFQKFDGSRGYVKAQGELIRRGLCVWKFSDGLEAETQSTVDESQGIC